MDFDFITQQMKDLGTSSVPSMQVVSPTHRHLPSWVPGIDFASLDSFHWIDHEAPCPPIPSGRSQGSICRLQVWKLIHLQHFYVGEPSPALTKEENPMQFFFNRRYPKDTWRWMSVCWFLRFLLFGEVLVFICPGGSPLSLEARDFGTFHGENWNLASCFGRVCRGQRSPLWKFTLCANTWQGLAFFVKALISWVGGVEHDPNL